MRTEIALSVILLAAPALLAAEDKTAAPVHADSGASVIDGIAAKINNDVITISDVMAEIRRDPELRTMGRTLQDETTFRRLYRDTVEAMVDRRLVLKAAVDAKMELQDWVVDNRVREIVKEGFDGDINKLYVALADSHIPFEEWRRTIREDLIVQAMHYQTVEKNVIASPGAMRAEYAVHPERYGAGGTVTVSVILLRPTAEGDTNTPPVEARANALIKRIDGGEPFAAVAKAESADSHAKDGGVWKDVKPEEVFRPEIVKVLKGLKPGERSGAINIEGWGFIVRKDSEAATRSRTFLEAYDDIERNVRREQSRKLHVAWMQRLRAEAFVKIYSLPEKK